MTFQDPWEPCNNTTKYIWDWAWCWQPCQLSPHLKLEQNLQNNRAAFLSPPPASWHCVTKPNFNQLQSAYRQCHSTEISLLVTLDSIFRSSDEGKPSTLISLNLSSAVDMIDHNILLSRLHTTFGITSPVLNFIESNLTGRSPGCSCQPSIVSSHLLQPWSSTRLCNGSHPFLSLNDTYR